MSISVDNEADMQAVFEALATDITDANSYLHVHLEMSQSYNNNAEIYRDASTFWWLMFGALHDALMLRLCRIYDQQSSSLSLYKMLTTIEGNIDIFKQGLKENKLGGGCLVDRVMEEERIPDKQELEADKKKCRQGNALVDKVIMNRNNKVAHIGAKHALGRTKIMEQNEMNLKDVQALLDDATAILNKYFRKYSGGCFETHVSGYEDVSEFIESIESLSVQPN